VPYRKPSRAADCISTPVQNVGVDLGGLDVAEGMTAGRLHDARPLQCELYRPLLCLGMHVVAHDRAIVWIPAICGYLPVDCQVGQVSSNLDVAKIAGMATAAEVDVAADPADVSLFGAQALVAKADGFADDIDDSGGSGDRHDVYDSGGNWTSDFAGP
jgi:hypothetical protein